MNKIALFIIVSLITIGCSGHQVREFEGSHKSISESIVTLLVQGDVKSVASKLHYPISYTSSERTQGESDVKESLAFLLQRFGSVSRVELHTKAIQFYEIGISGDNLKYWESLSPIQTKDFVYKVKFSKLGDGVLKVSVFTTASGTEVRGIFFGLEPSKPNARGIIIEIMK